MSRHGRCADGVARVATDAGIYRLAGCVSTRYGRENGPVADSVRAVAAGAAREIGRRQNGGPRVMIIAMTADALAGTREDCLAAGMDDYIAKPVRLDELDRVLRKWLSGVVNV